MNKQTIIMLAIAAVLVTALLLFENPFKEAERKPHPDEQVELFVVPDEADCARIELRGMGTSTTLVRKDHQWFTKEGYRADGDRVQQILNILKEAGPPDLVSISPDAFINFKVDQIQGISVRIYDRQNARKVDLIVGEMERDFFHTPVRKPESNNVYLIRGMLRMVLQQSDWRDRNIFRIDLASVRRVAVHRADESYALARESEGAPWHLVRPTSVPLSAEKVQPWLQQICMLYAQDLEPPATTDTLTSYGLTASSTYLSLGLDDGTTKTLIFGTANARKEYYVKRADDPQVFRLAEFYFTNLLKKSDELKAPAAPPLPPAPPAPAVRPTTGPAHAATAPTTPTVVEKTPPSKAKAAVKDTPAPSPAKVDTPTTPTGSDAAAKTANQNPKPKSAKK
ncbi:MAG: DUF4340 domain-containing protein [Candidatus Sumerlaeia bacterium]|nr:DUF4340 domain-containing protein [Candidatus Sumerlaeia bacterium]